MNDRIGKIASEMLDRSSVKFSAWQFYPCIGRRLFAILLPNPRNLTPDRMNLAASTLVGATKERGPSNAGNHSRIRTKTLLGHQMPSIMKNPVAFCLAGFALILIAVLTTTLPAQMPAAAGTEAVDNIGRMNSGDLLTLIVALSVYIATIRFVALGRLSELRTKAEDQATDTNTKTALNKRRSDLRGFLLLLIPADAPLVVAGVFLTWHLLGSSAPAWARSSVPMLFGSAIVVLAIHHLVAWGISIANNFREPDTKPTTP